MGVEQNPQRRSLLKAGAALALGPVAGTALPSPAAAASGRTPPIDWPELSRRSLRYGTPATDWQSEALPVGNGRLGAMLFGGPAAERVQFNEHSLWGGLNDYDNALMGQPDDAFDTSVTGFGSYRAFGDLRVALGGTDERAGYVSSPSGHGDGGPHGIAASVDGDAATAWQVVHRRRDVSWQADLATAAAVTSYRITSASGERADDPRGWTLSGSRDGLTWDVLDERTDERFAGDGDTRTFPVSGGASCSAYRLTFHPRPGSARLRVAGIALAGSGFDTADGPVRTDYRRALDPYAGVQSTGYRDGGQRVLREAFVSHDADCLVLRYRTDAPAGLSGTVSLTSAQDGAAASVDAAGSRLRFAGTMANDLRFACDVRVVGSGRLARDGDAVRFDGCRVLTLYLDARTDYALDAAAGWRGGDPVPVAAAAVAKAAAADYGDLYGRHVRRYAALMSRAEVTWGRTDPAVARLGTDLRRARYAAGGEDPELEQTMFDYGRYLLVSSSRPGGLPANLQGLWNDSNQPAWASDYHTNINVEMNYWAAETTNLPDSHLPLLDFVEQVAVPSRVATRNAFGAGTRGWTARTSQSVFGGNGWEWNTVASAWYMHHVAQHYAFTRDRDFLRRRGYPMVREICRFWEDRLVERADGLLVSPNGWSPEHGPREDGVMYDQQIIWDLFTNYLELARALDTDHAYQARIADLRDRLAPNKIGRWGQLQEWQTDRDDPEDIHRHTSHLFAVYPGRQITPAGTPDFAAAALVSLKARCGEKEGVPFDASTVSGDSRRSWTWPWRAALFARLGDGHRARIMLRGLLTYNTLPNLFCNHPPFQMDGNFGMPGAVAEMLLQSHEGVISLLPACPSEWADGSFSGLRARGGYTVSAVWRAGRVTSYSVVADRAADPGRVKVRVNGREVRVTPRKG